MMDEQIIEQIGYDKLRKREYIKTHLDEEFPIGSSIDCHTHAEGIFLPNLKSGRLRETQQLRDLEFKMIHWYSELCRFPSTWNSIRKDYWRLFRFSLSV